MTGRWLIKENVINAGCILCGGWMFTFLSVILALGVLVVVVSCWLQLINAVIKSAHKSRWSGVCA